MLYRFRRLRLLDLHRARCSGLIAADRADVRNVLLTGVLHYISGDLGAEIHADQRCRDHGCGDRGDYKSPPRGRSALRFGGSGLRLDYGDSDACRRNLTRRNVIILRRRSFKRSPARGQREDVVPSRLRRCWGARSTFSLQKMLIALWQTVFITLQHMPIRWCDRAGLAILPDPRMLLNRPVSELIGPTRVILKNDDLPVSRYCF